MPGGDLAALKPARMLASILSKSMEREQVEKLFKKRGLLKGLKYGKRELQTILNLIEKGKGPKTSSTGRFLDSASALLNICLERTYEGEPAIMLEDTSTGGRSLVKDIDQFLIDRHGQTIILTGEMMRFLSEKIEEESKKDLAYTAQYILGASLGSAALAEAERLEVDAIYVSGGAAVNHVLLKAIKEHTHREINVNRLIPPGDGGIAVGQAYIAGKLQQT